ncbi:MAG: sigma-54 dependent transcriptional regulator [Gammaproteobacteria bacterium]|nr:sigma-54 dependent transcriptional regulator [Gammaproteobacteria bacterium]
MSRILVVDDDQASARMLQLHLRSQGFDTAIAHDADSGLAQARDRLPELVILDIRMPGRSGLDVLPELKALEPAPHIIMITAFHDMQTTIEAMQKGAEDYIHKPVDIDELDAAVERLLDARRSDHLVPTEDAAGERFQMVGRSRAMKEVFKTIGLVARSTTTVLITGESGTGKELVARAIHDAGENAAGPFVVVNCAAVVETLLESDMFGHEKGAFTGAAGRQPGKFALAQGGTIFLDEVGEMSPAMQAKLLRVLQYKEFTPLGSKAAQHTDARIIAATNVALGERVAQGAFREDLLYRLQVVNVHLPPLRERAEDLDDLVHALLARINRDLRSSITHIDQAVLDCLAAYAWPGNVRELENVLLKAVALSAGSTLTAELLPDELRGSCAIDASAAAGTPAAALDSLADMERNHVARVLQATGWHRGEACAILGISRPRLRRMMREYGLSPPGGFDGDDT